MNEKTLKTSRVVLVDGCRDAYMPIRVLVFRDAHLDTENRHVWCKDKTDREPSCQVIDTDWLL